MALGFWPNLTIDKESGYTYVARLSSIGWTHIVMLYYTMFFFVCLETGRLRWRW